MSIDLEAIRAQDAEESGTEAQIAVRYDRRALLAYVDELRAAAGKVTCRRCDPANPGVLHEFYSGKPYPCTDCADLRKLLGDSP